MAKETGNVIVIIIGVLFGLGALTIGVTSYNLNAIYDEQPNKPFIKKNDTDDSDNDEEQEEENILERITDLSYNLKDIDNSEKDDPYAFKGGKRSRCSRRSKRSKKSKKNKKSKKTSKK